MHLPIISVIIVNTNELHHLKRCLPAVLGQRYGEYEVLVVDNGSTDGSVEFLKREFPQVRVIQNAANLGYAGANNVGFAHGSGQYLVVLNPDTTVEPDWLRELVIALENDPGAGLATPKILLMDDPQRVNACGNDITFTGLTACRGAGEATGTCDQPAVVPAVSGASFAIPRAVLDQIGGFDERFFIYYEDTHLSLRAALAGYHCIYVPTSVVYHQYSFRLSAKKCFLLERNRLFSLVTVFRWGTLLLLLPTLVLGEMLMWGYVLPQGFDYARNMVESYAWIARNWCQVMDARRRTQKLRRVPDRQLLQRLSLALPLTQIARGHFAAVLEALIQPMHWAWGRVCQAVVIW